MGLILASQLLQLVVNLIMLSALQHSEVEFRQQSLRAVKFSHVVILHQMSWLPKLIRSFVAL